MTLLEISTIFKRGRTRSNVTLDSVFAEIAVSSQFRVLPIDFEIAKDVPLIEDDLRDPFDAVIVATARVHKLRLVTSDERIITSDLVDVID